MKICGIFLIVFVVAPPVGIVWRGLPESLVALTELHLGWVNSTLHPIPQLLSRDKEQHHKGIFMQVFSGVQPAAEIHQR